MAKLDISNAHRQVLAELYEQARLTVDQLPYTEEFERLYTEFVARSGRALTRNEVWRAGTMPTHPLISGGGADS